MDFHLDRGLRFNVQPEHKSLYSWAIVEVGKDGQQVGSDQIPWHWTQTFTAKECLLVDSVGIRTKHQREGDAVLEVTERQIIRAFLTPGRADGEDSYRRTRYSMFGTDRQIKDFQLDIHILKDSTEQERCEAWGSVSYTAEIDFRDDTTEDCVIFYLFVSREKFERYASLIAQNAVDQIAFHAGMVDGFYSEWSPAVSTNHIKVLTRANEHQPELPADLGFELPRLGQVGEAELYVSSKRDLRKKPAAAEVEPDDNEDDEDDVVPQVRPSGDTQTVKLLSSLKNAAWVIAGMSALILIATIF